MGGGAQLTCCRVWAAVTAAFAITVGLVGEQYTPLLLQRDSDASCLPAGFAASGPEPLHEALTRSLLDEFERDGAVLIRGGLRCAAATLPTYHRRVHPYMLMSNACACSPAWVSRLRDTVEDSFQHPTVWDKMYTTGLAAFFCAQKTVMLPMTSRCGQNMVRTLLLRNYRSLRLRSAPRRRLSLPFSRSALCRPLTGLSLWLGAAGAVLPAGIVRRGAAGQQDDPRR
jgi:hypothetical protein